MQNIYVYNRKDKIGKLIWYRGIVFYPYVVTHNHSYNRMFLYSGSIDDRIVVDCMVYKKMGEAQIQKIRQGELASKETLNTICRLLQIQPGDLLEYVEEI